MKKIIIFLITLTISVPTLFAETGIFTLEAVMISNASKTMWLQVDKTIENTACTKKNQFRFELDPEFEVIFDKLVSMAITAKATDSKVKISYNQSSCLYDAPIITYMTLY